MKQTTATINPFPVNPNLTATSILYKNPLFIADEILPKKKVESQSFNYQEYSSNSTENFTPKTKKGSTNAVTMNGLVFDEDISDPVDLCEEVEYLTDQNELKRELRVVKMITNPDNFSSLNRVRLTGEDRFSNPESDMVDVIEHAIKMVGIPPNRVAMSNRVWNGISHNKQIRSACGFYNNNTSNQMQLFAQRFSLGKINVGCSYYNTARSPLMNCIPVWGDFMFFYFTNTNADIMQGGITFGLTAQWGERVAGLVTRKGKNENKTALRQCESLKEVFIAKDLGYLICFE